MNKPIKPDITIPQSFAENGVKTDFDDTLLADGFDNLRPDVLAGDNLNKFIDDTYKGLNYGMAAADALNLINEGETLIVRDGKFTSGAAGGGGLEIGDIGFTQMAIDESKGLRRILNGQVIIQDQYVQFTNIIKESVALNPSLACTESEWQTAVTMSAYGLCDKFVIDDEAGTIRLPKYPDYFIGGVDVPTGNIPVAGNGKTLGLTNGNNNTGLWAWSGEHIQASVDSYNKALPSKGTNNIVTGNLGVTTDSTKSGIIAKLSNDQTEQIKGTYFIQVATGAETKDEITNEHELVNPYVLLEPKFFETPVYNLSWLISNGSFTGSKAVHPHAYDALLIELNADIAVGTTQNNYTKRGLPVKLATDSYTDYDFVVNPADETFRPPLKVNLASSKAVVGNGKALGLTDGVGTWSLSRSGGSADTNLSYRTYHSENLPITDGTSNPSLGLNRFLGVTTDPTKSGIELADSNLYLYFYVGEVAQNTNLVNAGRIEETLVKKVDMQQATIASFPSKKYIDLTLGASGTSYTAPANGLFYFSKKASASAQWFQLSNKGKYSINLWSSGSGQSVSDAIECLKGDVITVSYTLGGTTDAFRFIYAEGEI